MQWANGNSITFDSAIATVTSAPWGKANSQLLQRKPSMAASPSLSSFARATSRALSSLRPKEVSNLLARSQTSSPGEPQVYLLENISCAFESFRLFAASTVIP